jgi:hypothetical protein
MANKIFVRDGNQFRHYSLLDSESYSVCTTLYGVMIRNQK